MTDVARTASQIEHQAYAAEHGDSKALRALHTEFHSLSSQDLKLVAVRVQEDMKDSASPYYSNVGFSRDEQGNVMAMSFSPTVVDRVRSLGEAHSVHVTATPVDNFNASPEMAERATSAFEKLPLKVRELVVRDGLAIDTVDKMPDAAKYSFSNWLTQTFNPHPRGYPEGSTWDNSSGYQNRGKIVMSEHYKFSDGKTYTADNVEGTVRHEVGHDVDRLLGSLFSDLSDSSDFKAAYDKDVAKIPAEDKAKLGYFLQEAGGHSETFAEVFAQINGGGAGSPEVDALLDKYFTNTRQFIQAHVPS